MVQKVFPKLGYEGWQGLSTAELSEKAKPFSQQLAETWIRMRRAHPEKQSSRQPFKKSKWSENAVYQAQDAVYEKIDGEAEMRLWRHWSVLRHAFGQPGLQRSRRTMTSRGAG